MLSSFIHSSYISYTVSGLHNKDRVEKVNRTQVLPSRQAQIIFAFLSA